MRLHLLEEIVFVVSNDLSHISSRILLYIYISYTYAFDGALEGNIVCEGSWDTEGVADGKIVSEGTCDNDGLADGKIVVEGASEREGAFENVGVPVGVAEALDGAEVDVGRILGSGVGAGDSDGTADRASEIVGTIDDPREGLEDGCGVGAGYSDGLLDGAGEIDGEALGVIPVGDGEGAGESVGVTDGSGAVGALDGAGVSPGIQLGLHMEQLEQGMQLGFQKLALVLVKEKCLGKWMEKDIVLRIQLE